MWGNIFKCCYLSSWFTFSCAFLATLWKLKFIFGQVCPQTIFRLNQYSRSLPQNRFSTILEKILAFPCIISQLVVQLFIIAWWSDAVLFELSEAGMNICFQPLSLLLCGRTVHVATQWTRSGDCFCRLVCPLNHSTSLATCKLLLYQGVLPRSYSGQGRLASWVQGDVPI